MTTNHKPWNADKTWVRMGDGVIATIIRTYPEAATDDELCAAARKIAAAPDLLAKAEWVVAVSGRGLQSLLPAIDELERAIAKAKGE